MPSAGSFFRNPPGDSAGRIIDELGLKGLREGGASVSQKHANFIVNDAKGTATDVRRLGDRVAATVRAERGIELVPEVVFAGDWGAWEPAA
jgi:UDP-N-acetylmuramate dehydrogenase